MPSVTFSLSPEVSDHALSPRIEQALTNILPAASEAIEAKDIQIRIGFDVDQTIPETGVGGSTDNPHLVLVWIDPGHKNVQENIEREIKSTVVHELHHAMRNRIFPWPGTLLDDIIGEGLADHYDIEINGNKPKPWSQALSEEQLDQYYDLSKPHFNHQNSEDDYYKWVLGLEDDNIPHWAGYALGYKLVDSYLKSTGKKASELVETPSLEFIK